MLSSIYEPTYFNPTQCMVLVANEVTAEPGVTGTVFGSPPTQFVTVGQTNNYVLKRPGGRGKGYAIGDVGPVGNTTNRRVTELSFDASVANLEFLQDCLLGGAAPLAGVGVTHTNDGVPQLCFYVGVKEQDGAPVTDYDFADYIRYAVCESLALRFAQNSDMNAAARFLAQGCVPASSPLEVSHATLTAIGNPFSWTNTISITIGGKNYRAAVDVLNVLYSVEITPEGCRTYEGENNPLSLAPYLLTVGHRKVIGNLSFKGNVDPALLREAANSSAWGDIAIGCRVQTVTKNPENMVVTTKEFTTTIVNATGGDDIESVSRGRALIQDFSFEADNLIFSDPTISQVTIPPLT